MRAPRRHFLAALAAGLAGARRADAADAPAVSPREQAVAIDRVSTAIDEPFEVERLARGLRRPWSLAFISEAELLISEKHGGVRVYRDGRLDAGALPGGPTGVLAKEDSGLLDIALDPEFATTRLIYLAFVEGDEKANRTAIWKARYDGRALLDGRVIFRSRSDKSGPGHPGGRLLFLPDRSLLLTMGDGFEYKAAAQDLGSHLGKTLRLTRDGAAAPGNPFIDRAGALPEIWTYGHRNAQGLALHPETGDVWLHEHGPRGGDELNRLRAGANYGWPLVTHGIDYNGTLISEHAHGPDFERSSFYWAPSIAPSGLAIYRGSAFPDWKGKFFVGALAARCVVRLRRGQQTGFFVEDERMLAGLKKRIRDLREGPEGWLYLLTDDDDGELLRLRPKR